MTRFILAAIMLPFAPGFAIAVVCAAIGGILVAWAVRELARPVADDVERAAIDWAITKALFAVEDELRPWARAGCPTAEVIPFRRAA